MKKQPVRRMAHGGGIDPKAKALGKAEGYADVGPVIGMVGPLVGVETS